MKKVLSVLAVVTIGLLAAPVAGAQEITGTITGIVVDTSGAVIPGVTVKVRNTGTNVTTSVVTDETGMYVAPFLSVGDYEVSAAQAGFKEVLRKNLELHVNDRLRVDIVFEAGNIEETVTVTAESPIVQTQSSEVSTLINQTQVAQMPLNGRNIMSLVQMQPGVSSGLNSTILVGLGNLTSVYVNGNRASQNNWMIDGADNNDVGSNLALINYVNVDAVGEIKILRSNYSAEFGRSGGAQVNVVTKGGSNRFSGTAFEFLRNDRFDAINFFSVTDYDGDGKRDPSPLDYHNFGGTFGGPVKKDKLFFFYGQEFRRIERVLGGGVQNTRVATQKQREGDFSEFPSVVIKDPVTGIAFPGNRIPDERIDPLAKALLGRFPNPNADPAALGSNRNFSVATPTIRNFREELVRLDYRHSDSHSVYGRFIHDSIPSEEPFGEIFGTLNAAFPGVANTKTNNPGTSFVGAWNWIVSPTMVNEVAFNYSRGAILSEITGNAARDVAIPKVFSGAPGDDLLPGIAFGSGGYGGFNFFGPYDNTYGSYRIKETLSWVRKAHALKFGFLGSWEFKNENSGSGTNGSFNFPGTSTSAFTSAGDAFADFLLGRASSYSETNIDIMSHLRFQMYELFAQDDWRVNRNLTLNLGVRWSIIMQPYDTEDVLTNFDPGLFDRNKAYQIGDAASGFNNLRIPGTGDPLNGIVIAGRNSAHGRRITTTQWNTLGPRAGFAWDPKGNGVMAVRGGYGRYFDRTLVGIALQNAFVNPPFAFSALFSASGANVPMLANPQGGAQRNNETLVPSLNAVSADFKIPTVDQWSIGMQRQLPLGLNADIAYVGSHGSNLLRPIALNQTPVGTVAPTNRARPYPGYANITLRDTSASSMYHSLQASLQRRFSGGLQVTANYTLSRAVSDSSSDRNTGDIAQDTNNLAAERALTTYDRTHIFGIHYIWDLPFYQDTANKLLYNVLGGWQVSGSTRLSSGVPLTITASTNSANSFGGGSLRPDLVGEPEGPKTIAEWFNRAAFAQPAPNTFGDAPRSVVRGPGANITDLAVFKNFQVTGRVRLQYRFEVFNAFNTTQFSTVGTALGNPNFGRVTAAGEPRLIQMGFKVTF